MVTITEGPVAPTGSNENLSAASTSAPVSVDSSAPRIDAAAHVPIEADSSSDYDSDSVASDLTSVSSSIFEYQYENGRRYHAYRAGRYMLPNDEKEQERLDLMHHVFRLALGGDLCYTKLDSPMKILDIGTGTGIWAIQIADEYPGAQVIGTELSPIQPDWVPPNLSFIVDDCEAPWAFPRDSFDFIHIRSLSGSIRNWPVLLQQAYAHLKPGGRIEISEGRPQLWCDDGSYTKESAAYRWVTEFHRIAASMGVDFDAFEKYPGWLQEAGFQHIIAEQKPCPIGTWPRDPALKNIGRVFKYQFVNGAIDSYSLALFTRGGGWSSEETIVLLSEVRNEFMKGNKLHTYSKCSYVVAEKPL